MELDEIKQVSKELEDILEGFAESERHGKPA